MDPRAARRYTLWLVYCADLDQYILLAQGQRTDPIYVAIQSHPSDALESLAPTPYSGSNCRQALRWALDEVRKQDPGALDTYPEPPVSTWDLASELWRDAEKWTPYSYRIDAGEFHLSWLEKPGQVPDHLETCPATEGEIKDTLADYARMCGRSPFVVTQLHKTYFAAMADLNKTEAP